jgi:hypothetical protein
VTIKLSRGLMVVLKPTGKGTQICPVVTFTYVTINILIFPMVFLKTTKKGALTHPTVDISHTLKIVLFYFGPLLSIKCHA